jgi:SWIM zinc finger
MEQLLQTLNRMGATALPESDGYSNRFQIASASSTRVYVVAQRKPSGQWACSCPGAIYHKGHTCKHLRALGLAS